MDFTALAFYAIVCGLLSVFAPNLGGVGARMAVGAVVGVIAAALLPFLRTMMGGY